MTMWLLQLAIIIVACGCFGALAERIGQSRVVGEIAAGIVMGPSVLGWISPSFYNMTFGPVASTGISQLGDVGVLMLMFEVGLHLDLDTSTGLRSFKPALLVALGGIAVPLILGMAVAALSWPTLAAHFSRSSYVLFCGVALSVSAVPVMGKIVLDLQMTRHPAAKLALSAAMLTDLAGWIMLSIVASLTIAASGPATATKAIGCLLGFVCGSALLVRLLVRPMCNACKSPGRLVSVIVPYVLISSWVSASLGFHSVFGALAAAVLLRDIPNIKTCWDSHLGGFVRVVLLPVFFAYAGLHASLSVLATSTAWFWFAMFFSIAFFGKFGGSYWGARLSGFDRRTSAIVGSLMNTRGLMELIVLSIGLQLHVLPENVYAIFVTIALVTTSMTVPLVRLWRQPTILAPISREVTE